MPNQDVEIIDHEEDPHLKSSTQLMHNQPTGFLALEPEAMVKFATRVANTLKGIITQQGLSKDLSRGRGKPYVLVEGWITLGSLLGILPKEEYVKEHEDGTFEVGISLVRQSDGRVISSSSAICGGDEATWNSRPKYARRSMAATRATGKAYRMAFGWIMSLAGYEVTPAEEMPDRNPNDISPSIPSESIPFNQETVVTSTELYKATDAQKITLGKLCKEAAIHDPAVMKKVSEIMKDHNMNMSQLKNAIKELKENKEI